MIDFTGAVWRKSARSQGSGDACVEVADLATVVAVRDSKDRSGPALAFDRASWALFAEKARAGRFDR